MLSRRSFLRASSSGFGYLAFAALAHQQCARGADASNSPLASKPTHFAPRAKRVIFLCMEGGPSHLDTFDYKPQLSKDDGKPASADQSGRSGGRLLASPFNFQQYGESGHWISELFPHLAHHADKLCLLNGMHTNLPAHAQAYLQMHCGIFQFPRPSMGAWALYGLGCENENLPGFVTINPPKTNGGAANYAASFLPAVYQGARINLRAMGGQEVVPNLRNTRRNSSDQRRQLDLTQALNQNMTRELGGDAHVEGLISSYELAFRMQSEMPAVLDLNQETRETLDLYGISATSSNTAGGRGTFGGSMFGQNMFARGGTPSRSETDNFGRQCLLARRLVEAGVRFVELTMGGWDHHFNLKESLETSCQAVDKPIAGLLADLQRRGLLEDTLVLWGGEFGRSPIAQGDGRDHNNRGFTMWMAGGGVKPGYRHGETDEYGREAIAGRVHIHDWHATILHLLGLDHQRLTYRYAGREMRLTDVKGQVVEDIIG